MIETYTTTTGQTQPTQWVMLIQKVKQLIKQPKFLIGLTLTVVLSLGLGLAVIQTQQSQENRSDASTGSLPTPDVKFVVATDQTHSHDQQPGEVGLQLTTGDSGMVDLKLDPKGLPVVGVEAFLQYNPDKLSLGSLTGNTQTFKQFAQIKRVGDSQLRLLALIAQDQSPINQLVDLGSIQLNLKQASGANLVLTRLKFIVDHPTPTRELTGLAHNPETALAQQHLVPIEPNIPTTSTPTVTQTPTLTPTTTATPTPVTATSIPDVTVDGELVIDQTGFDQAGNLQVSYHLTTATPTDWQVNVVAVPSTQTDYPLTTDKRVRSNDCKNVQPGQTCQLTVPKSLLDDQTTVFVFANQFKSYGQKVYYCSWSDGGQWVVTDHQGKILDEVTATSRCTNSSLTNFSVLPDSNDCVDAAITNFITDQTNPLVGEKFDVSATVKNIGDQSIHGVDVYFFQDLVGNPTTDKPYFKKVGYNVTLLPNQTFSVSATNYQIDQAGTHQLTAWAHVVDTTAECQLSNNQATTTVEVSATRATNTPTPTAVRQPPNYPGDRTSPSPTAAYTTAQAGPGQGLTDQATIDPQVFVDKIVNQKYQPTFDLNQDHQLDLKDFTVWWQQ